jgi:hypothetical protein
MSFLSGFKSFFDKVGSVLEKFFGSSSVEQKIQGALTVVGAAITTISGLAAGPAASAEVSNILKMVQTDYATFCAIVQDGTPAPGSTPATAATTALNSLKTNLTAILTDAGVKNSADATKIQNEVTTIINELEAIEASFVPAAAPPAA